MMTALLLAAVLAAETPLSPVTVPYGDGPQRTGDLHRPKTFRDDAEYLRRKWREDLSDPLTGLDATGMRRALEDIVRDYEDKEPWQVTKARMFECFCDRTAIDVSGHDWFPTFARWSRFHDLPQQDIIRARGRKVDERRIPKEIAEIRRGNDEGYWCVWKDTDHSVPDWDRILALGFPGMKRELEANRRDTPFYRACGMTADACLRFLARFVEKGMRNAERGKGGRRVSRQVESLERLRAGAPQTAYDAMMFMYLYWVFSENGEHYQVRSLGNLDRLLTPFYERDLAAGRTTEAEFREQLRHFWWQWGSIGNTYCQPVYLGGTREDGTSEYNDVSRIILDVHDELYLPTPKVQLKIADNTPEWVWKKALPMIRRTSSIVFCGEKPMTAAMRKLGYSEEECRKAKVFGCYEFGPRETANDTISIYTCPPKLVERMLAEAKDGTFDAADWDAFYADYRRRFVEQTESVLRVMRAWESTILETNPANLYSLTSAESVKNGKDAFFDGMKYERSHCSPTGVGTAVDALLAVKELVYERKEMTLAELGRLMAENWKDREDLRLRMARSKRKWGNNDPEANAIGSELCHVFASLVTGKPNSRGGIFIASTHSTGTFVGLGRKLGATPDGRRRGDEVSKNISPTPGADTEGATALVSTIGSIDASEWPGDMPLDVMLLPATVADDKGLEMVRRLIETYHANGGFSIHFNVMDAAMLRDAQKHPERYATLQVRVCGWNTLWNNLSKREQEAYIRRAESIVQ